jgi:hypothetical protein
VRGDTASSIGDKTLEFFGSRKLLLGLVLLVLGAFMSQENSIQCHYTSNNFLNPKSSYERIPPAPPCRLIHCVAAFAVSRQEGASLESCEELY